MKRLRHTYKAYIATFRMTQSSLVVFFEGKENDPIFYTRVRQEYEKQTGRRLELRRASELPRSSTQGGGSGGKFWLLRAGSFWSAYYTKRRPSVRCSIMLALDKDVDDIFQVQDPSVKIVRTEGYAVENYMVVGSDLDSCATAALSLLPGEISPFIGPSQNLWLRWAAELWQDWICFCLLAKTCRHHNLHGYSRKSRFNRPHHSPAAQTSVEAEFEKLRVASGLNEGEFAARKVAISNYVQSTISAGTYDQVFKGEWYIDILVSQLTSDPYLNQVSVQAGSQGIWSSVRKDYLLKQSTYDYYKAAFDDAQLSTP